MTTITVSTPPCPVCHKATVVILDKARYDRWRAGEMIQSVFPEIPKEQRETLISGAHPECWDRLFSGEE